MKKIILSLVIAFTLFSGNMYSQFDIADADIILPTGSSLANADWNKTYNSGMTNEVLVSSGGAEIQNKTPCNKGTKTNALSLSSDSYLAEMSIPAANTAVFSHVMLDIVGNSENISGSHQIWGSTSSTFDLSKAYKVAEFPVVGYGGTCADAHKELMFPAGLKIKSIRIYGKKAKDVLDNGDGTYSIGAGSDDVGSNQTLNIFTMYAWLEKGPQMLNYNVFGFDSDAIDHTAGSVHVTVPYVTDFSIPQTPIITLSPGASYDATSTYTDLDPITFSTTPNPSYILTDGSDNKTYTITVEKVPASTANSITSFALLGSTGVIDEINKEIAVEVPYSMNLIFPHLPIISVSNLATLITTGSQTFTAGGPATPFTVRAEDGTDVVYDVTVTKAAASTENRIKTFSMGATIPLETVVINHTLETIDVTVAASAVINSIDPIVTRESILSSITSPSPLTNIDFTSPVPITITAEDGTPKTYTVTVTKDTTSPTLTNSNPTDGEIDFSLAGEITLEYDEDVILGAGAFNLAGGTLGTAYISGSSTVKIPFSGLSSLSPYTLITDANAVTDIYGNNATTPNISFTTADGENKVYPYASLMDGAAFAQPAFITGGTYDATADSKAATTTQYGAYVLAPNEELVINSTKVGSVLATIYAPGESRSVSITNTANALTENKTVSTYNNNGFTISQTIDSSSPTTITIKNTSTVGDIYIPYIYLSDELQPALDEKTQWCK